MPPGMASFAHAFAHLMGLGSPQTPGAPVVDATVAGPMMMEAMRQWIMSRADFWKQTMEAMASMASHAATIATEARKSVDQMGAGCANIFPSGWPWTPAASVDLDVEKLKQSLKGIDQAEADKIIYAVQFVQAMDAWRRSAPGANPTGTAKKPPW
jgi:hypothetical protein